MPVTPYQPIYKVSEAAKLLKMNINDVYNLMNAGKLPYILLGSKKIKGKDLEAFINTFPAEMERQFAEKETQTA